MGFYLDTKKWKHISVALQDTKLPIYFSEVCARDVPSQGSPVIMLHIQYNKVC